MSAPQAVPWWREGVIYQIYPRSFADSNGDGIGDLRGITERLEYLAWLGVDALWLNPTFPSPNADWGFDVSDYRGVHPELGTLGDLDELVARASELGLRVVLDLVPNHTSDQHPWFVDARASRDARHRSWYVWRDGRQDGLPPNNWRSVFGGLAWKYDERTAQWYLHNFLPEQPDLDWWSDEVRAEFDDILTWWFNRGIAGFRIDVAHGIVKDRELRDNPQADAEDIEAWRRLGQRPVFSMYRDEVHEVLRHWRALSDTRPDRPVLIGETWVHDVESLARFYGQGTDELHLAFNFVFLLAQFDVKTLAPIVARTEELLPGESWPVWTLSNHDVTRFPTRWAQGDPDRARCALLLVLTLRGTPVLYYGDELGMEETDVPPERRRDPAGTTELDGEPGRDGVRTPMPWSAEPGAGFSRADVEPWLPFGDLTINVADQRVDPGSMLHLGRDLIALRRSSPDLRGGGYSRLPAPAGVWAFARGEGMIIALNLGSGDARVEGVRGRVAIGTRRQRDGEDISGTLTLGPAEGVVVRTGAGR